MNNRGFALITLVFLMLVVAIMAIAVNRRAAMRVRMASNQAFAVGRSAAGDAVLERGLWQLTVDPCYRTAVTGEVFRYDGADYLLRILSAPEFNTNGPAGYDDAVVVDCRDAESNALSRAAYRYQLDTEPLHGSPAIKKPNQVAMDTAGNLYIADTDRHRIRKVTPDGTMSTVAGTGDSGHDGNDGMAVHARLHSPEGVAVAANGDLFIADTKNHWVRKVDAQTQVITLYAGSVDDGAPDKGVFDSPRGICVANSGNVYVADTENHRIRRINTWRNVSTFAGTGDGGYSGDGGAASSAQLNKPHGIFIGPYQWRMYIADTENHCIRRIDAWSGRIWTAAGIGTSPGYSGDGGPAAAARLKKPRAVFVDKAFNMFIADNDNDVIRIVSGHDGIIRTLAGTGSGGLNSEGLWAVESRLKKPAGIAMSALRGGREILISDSENDRIAVLRLDVEPLLY
jgi:hypothetical protein